MASEPGKTATSGCEQAAAPSKHSNRGGPKYTKHDDAIVRREWARGTLSKHIGPMLDPPRNDKSIMRRRRKLGLPERQHRGRRNKRNETSICCYMARDLKERAQARAVALGIPFARYVANLIRRDLGV